MKNLTEITRLWSLLKRSTLLSRWGVFLLFLFAGCWVFWDVGSFRPILYDDPDYLEGRPVGWGAGYWKEVWTSPVVNLWHPLTVISHDVVSRFGGGLVWRHHLVNVLLHLGVGMSVVYWLRGLRCTWAGTLGAALLWTFHPALVESVAWVSGRKDVLSGFFMILSLGLAARGRSGWVILLFGIGALLAKPVAIVLPVILVVQDMAMRKKSLWDSGELWGLVRKYGFLALAAAGVVAVTLYFQAEGGQATTDPRGVVARLCGAGWGIWRAAALWFWPLGLHTAYEDPKALPVWYGMVALVVLGAGGWGMCSAKLRIGWRLGLALFICFLLPTLGFVRAGNHLVADRYLYLSGLGLTLIVVGELARWRVGLVMVGILAIVLGGLTKEQRSHWKTTRALFSRVLAVEPQHSYALAKIGNLERREGRLESAKEYYAASLALDSGSPDAHRNLAELALEAEDYRLAYHHSLELSKRWVRDGWLHERLGKLAFNLGERAAALTHIENAVKWTKGPGERKRMEMLRAEMASGGRATK